MMLSCLIWLGVTLLTLSRVSADGLLSNLRMSSTGKSSSPRSVDDVFIINIIGDTLAQQEEATKLALVYLKTFGTICESTLHCRAFMAAEPTSSSLQQAQIQKLQDIVHGEIRYYPPSLVSANIGSSNDDAPEHVSEVLFALSTVEQEFRAAVGNPVALSLAFSASSSPSFDTIENFRKIFRKVGHSSSSEVKKVLLFEKNRELTSPSDWHDLQVVVLALASAVSRRWLEVLQQVYVHHAKRHAFTLREPRVALMESIHHRDQESSGAHVGFLGEDDVCVHVVQGGGRHSSHGVARGLCSGQHAAAASIRLTCRCPPPAHRAKAHSCLCSHLFPPEDWARRIDVSPTAINDRVGLDVKEFLNKLPEYNKFGTARFRFASESDMPLGFCWETGDTQHEQLSQSKIYTNASHFVPFRHPVPPASYSSSPPVSVAIVSGSGGGRGLDRAMDMSLSRMYYAQRHGLAYQHLVSEAYAAYFGTSYLDKVMGMAEDYARNVMAKVPMILSAMHAHPQHDWIMWMDDDTWFNPGWLQMPLDVFLADVPADKLVVLGNHRSAQSNVLFIRNSFEGRKLGRDWLSIAMSGYVQCHGFDQGALEILIVSRLFEKVRPSHQEPASIRSPIPFNFTCLNEKWMEGGVAESGDLSVELLALAREQGGKAGQQLRGGDEPYPWGCNGGADWSCDFKFENILRHLGFIGVSGGFHRPLSSFSQGCANDFFPDFHVTSESATRPRLHVGFCSRPDEIQGTDFTYDGPLGGGNDYVRRQAVNGWMINHKSDINYYEMYTERNACRKSESFVQKCDEALVASMIRRKEKKNDQLVFMTHGYAYDVRAKQFCTGGAALLEFQKKETFMTFYPKVIESAKQVSEQDWHKRQARFMYGEYQPIEKFKKYFQPHNYCEAWCSGEHSESLGADALHCKMRKNLHHHHRDH